MFRFGEPLYLYLLIVVPILAAFYFYSNYRLPQKIERIWGYGASETAYAGSFKVSPGREILAYAGGYGYGDFHACPASVRL